MLVENWKSLWKSWSMQFAALGLVLPEVLQLIADNTSLLPGLDPQWAGAIRVACLVAVVLLRPVKQKSLE